MTPIRFFLAERLACILYSLRYRNDITESKKELARCLKLALAGLRQNATPNVRGESLREPAEGERVPAISVFSDSISALMARDGVAANFWGGKFLGILGAGY